MTINAEVMLKEVKSGVLIKKKLKQVPFWGICDPIFLLKQQTKIALEALLMTFNKRSL